MIQTRIVRAWVVLVLCSAAWAEDSPPGPESGATSTAPTSTAPAEGPAPGRGNVSEAAIELSERERTALGAVRDRNTQLAETGFFMLLARAAKMETLSKERLEELESPSYANLAAYPARYRAQPVRMVVHVFASRKLQPTPGGEFPVSSDWPKDKPVWYLEGLVPSAVEERGQQPVLLYSVVDPTEVLGRPDQIEGQMNRYLGTGRPVELAGLFYKLQRRESREEGSVDYPVLLAWQVGRSGGVGVAGRAGGGFTTISALFVILVVLALLLGFIMLKRRVGQQKAARPGGPRYKPLRDVSQDDQAPAAEQEAGEVDPLLKQAAEQYQKERETHGKHGSS